MKLETSFCGMVLSIFYILNRRVTSVTDGWTDRRTNRHYRSKRRT